MKKIRTLDDPRLVYLGLTFLGMAVLVYILSFVFSFESLIALKPAAMGTLLCLLSIWGRMKKRG
ncbi:MAG: hypothetical protein H7301_02885 [Cryobacterium sp.]|nr:hypothetical protein [Oligoflexia bacterium]